MPLFPGQRGLSLCCSRPHILIGWQTGAGLQEWGTVTMHLSRPPVAICHLAQYPKHTLSSVLLPSREFPTI
uniref:Uncharacterized protein n=1 Tax=Anguilla anguilla TaxID=7936 RepID=A0A0E9SNE6_ANGAN